MIDRFGGVYKIISKNNPSQFYIGSAVDFIQRKRHHLSELKRNKHCNAKLQNHYNKYGKDDLIFSVVAICSRKDLIPENGIIWIEQCFIDSYKPTFNINKVAGSPYGTKQSPETIKKRVDKLIGKIPWNKGKKLPPFSDKHKKRIGDAQRGKVLTEETLAKMRKPKTLEHRRKLSIAAKKLPPRIGMHHSPATIQKLKIARAKQLKKIIDQKLVIIIQSLLNHKNNQQ